MRIILLITGLLLYGMYMHTTAPTVFPGDSGEIAAAAYTLGIGHPPGYPLYALSGKIFTLIPAGDPAFRLNLFSAVLGTCLFYILFVVMRQAGMLVRRGEKNEDTGFMPAYAAALIFCLSQTVWFHAGNVKGGIYLLAMNIALIAVFFLFRYLLDGHKKNLFAAVYTAGFLAAAHQAFFLLMTGIFVFGLVKIMKGEKVKDRCVFFGAFIISSFPPFLYLFVRAAAEPAPVVAWSGISTPGEVFGHIIRKAYFYSGRGAVSEAYAAKLGSYFLSYISNYSVMALFVPAGIYFALKKGGRAAAVVAALIVLNTFIFIHVINMYTGFDPNSFSAMAIHVTSGFYILNDIYFYILAGAGIYGAAGMLKRHVKKAELLTACVIAGALAASVPSNYRANDRAGNFIAYDYAENVLKTAGEGSILFVEEDYAVFNTLYVKTVLHKYGKVNVYGRSGNLNDISIYKEAKEANVEIKTRSGRMPRDKYRLLKERVTRMLGQNAEFKYAEKTRADVYYAAFTEFVKSKNFTYPYGCIYAFFREGEKPVAMPEMMKLCSMRNYYGPINDIYTAELIAEYFVKMAKHAAITGEKGRFEEYAGEAEKIAENSTRIMNLIAAIYYYDLKDTGKAIEYFEKMMKLDPYDFNTLKVLIRISSSFDPFIAEKWIDYYKKIMKVPYL